MGKRGSPSKPTKRDSTRSSPAGLKAFCWGYNKQVNGPVLEMVEGDHVRIYVTNRLIAPTSVHWHGFLIPNGMDGVGGLNQKAIQPGETYRYEFVLGQHGSPARRQVPNTRSHTPRVWP